MLQKLRFIICKYVDVKPEEIAYETDIREMGLTSFDVMNIVAECEVEFNVVIAERDIRTLLSIGDLAFYINRAK